ncbi:hypothetical protein [Paenibacillus sp. MER 99-2]|uniref:hypothetical protein n=1 Tax=Paenibacillus sp. MER 99-2 TaxID=2939572 RepID=UPI00204165A2|nr:hypothetical protein [Paenibacillus sp. MER 99-2]MCM3173092.1 hypothetical protein [Paenibacillus sp. MER 99-2]
MKWTFREVLELFEFIVIVLLLIIITLLLRINSKLPKQDPVKEAMERDAARKQKIFHNQSTRE